MSHSCLPCQPGTISSPLLAIIIVFNLNDVASLEHTKYVGMLKYDGALGREGGQGYGRERKNPSRSRERVIGHMGVSGKSLSNSLVPYCHHLWQAVVS